jgi:hypothetical protein
MGFQILTGLEILIGPTTYMHSTYISGINPLDSNSKTMRGKATMKVPSDLQQLKSARRKNCKHPREVCSANSGHFLCGSCRRLGQRLCREYHKYSCKQESSGSNVGFAALELYSRLKYEYVFNILDDSAFEDGSWKAWHWRDYGHTMRIHRLWTMVRDNHEQIRCDILEWLL